MVHHTITFVQYTLYIGKILSETAAIVNMKVLVAFMFTKPLKLKWILSLASDNKGLSAYMFNYNIYTIWSLHWNWSYSEHEGFAGIMFTKPLKLKWILSLASKNKGLSAYMFTYNICTIYSIHRGSFKFHET